MTPRMGKRVSGAIMALNKPAGIHELSSLGCHGRSGGHAGGFLGRPDFGLASQGEGHTPRKNQSGPREAGPPAWIVVEISLPRGPPVLPLDRPETGKARRAMMKACERPIF